MTFDLDTFIVRCDTASRSADAQAVIQSLLVEAIESPEEVAAALSAYSNVANLEDLVVFRSDKLTLLHGLIPPGFTAAPHNHNLWSVIAVYDGQEDNVFFERDGDGLKETRRVSVTAPGVLANDADVIHSICNPRETQLRAIHAYGGDLLATRRSNWDSKTHEEIEFDWQKVAGK